MKSRSTTQLNPCAMFVSMLEKIAFDNSRGGLFKWYVRKHAQSCGGCKDTLSALECYKNAVKTAYQEASNEGEKLMTQREVTSLLDKLST
ncbi:MAG: hypothetical protein WCG75_01660 [Armatimonadota bacterium]